MPSFSLCLSFRFFLQKVKFYGLKTSKKVGVFKIIQGGCQGGYDMVGAQNELIIVSFYKIESLKVIFQLVSEL